MKNSPNTRRLRGRGNGKRHPASRSHTFESHGPEGRIRGTAQQVHERYLVMARDASSSGDLITAESLFQHAEHYYRLLHVADSHGGERPRRVPLEVPPEPAAVAANDAAGDSAEEEAEGASY